MHVQYICRRCTTSTGIKQPAILLPCVCFLSVGKFSSLSIKIMLKQDYNHLTTMLPYSLPFRKPQIRLHFDLPPIQTKPWTRKGSQNFPPSHKPKVPDYEFSSNRRRRHLLTPCPRFLTILFRPLQFVTPTEFESDGNLSEEDRVRRRVAVVGIARGRL